MADTDTDTDSHRPAAPPIDVTVEPLGLPGARALSALATGWFERHPVTS